MTNPFSLLEKSLSTLRPLATVTTDKETISLTRVEIPIDKRDLLLWLDSQNIFPKFYLKTREKTITIASLGSLVFSKTPPQLKTLEKGPLFRFLAALPFSTLNSPLWEEFQGGFFLPSLELFEKEGQTFLAKNFLFQKDSLIDSSLFPFSLDQEENKHSSSQEKKNPPFFLEKKEESPSFSSWESLLQKIPFDTLQKVVLARKCSYLFPPSLSPLSLLAQISHEKATHFLYQPSPKKAFFGATPEKLYSRENTTLYSEALAGTKKKGEELLNSSKEQEEFAFVKEFIQKALSPLCTSLEVESSLKIFSTSYADHLYSSFKGNLKKTTSDKDLLETLHPTPALGGTPREKALAFLKKHEPFERGLYGAPIGWMEERASAFYVAIRSALIYDDTLHLFSGCGLTKKSNPQQEWEELEQKLQWLKR